MGELLLGFVVTAGLTILVAGASWRSSSLALRMATTLLTAFVIACLAYWGLILSVPGPHDGQASTWAPLVVGGYFLGGATAGVFTILITRFAKNVWAKRNAH